MWTWIATVLDGVLQIWVEQHEPRGRMSVELDREREHEHERECESSVTHEQNKVVRTEGRRLGPPMKLEVRATSPGVDRRTHKSTKQFIAVALSARGSDNSWYTRYTAGDFLGPSFVRTARYLGTADFGSGCERDERRGSTLIMIEETWSGYP